MKRVLIISLLCLVVLLVGCTASDPVVDDLYFRGDVYVWDGVGWDLLNGGFGGGAEADPVFTGSPAFGIVAGDIVAWNGHPLLTTGTHGVVGTIVGTSDAQALTNKSIIFNNNIPLQWKTFAGAPQDTLNLLASNILQITNPSGSVQILGGAINLNFNVDEEIYLWGGTKGTGRQLVLYSGYAAALDTLRDSPTIDMAASYWDGAAAVGWSGTILHDMITAGVIPKSQLKFAINALNILRLENNNGTARAYSDGVLDMTTHQIENVVDPNDAQDAATKNYVDSMGKTVSGSLTAGNANAIGFAWHNPESQDILIKKVVIEVTTVGGTVGSHLDVGIADDAAGTNRGTEFFDDLLLNSVQVNDDWKAADGGNQTKWVVCQDSVSATDGWVVGQILDANAAGLVGKYYIEYVGR